MALRSVLLIAFVAMVPSGFARADEPKPVNFREQVAPILVRSCLGCHNDKKAENGLNMTTVSLLKKGGKSSGAAILVAGEPDESELILSVRPDAEPRMPMKLPPLTDAAIQTLETWVLQGAKFDNPSDPDVPLASLVDPLKGLPDVSVMTQVIEPVTSVEFSPDGTILAATIGRNVQTFDSATGKAGLTFEVNTGPMNVVRFTPDGKALLAAGGRPGMFGALVLWDLASHHRLVEAQGHSDTILAAERSPDGKIIATGSYDRLIMLWDAATLKPLRTLKDHTDSVHALAFSPDGKTLASAGLDRTVKLWSVGSGTRDKTLADSTAELYAVTFSPDGSTVLASGVDRSIRAWRVIEKDVPLVKSFFAHGGSVLRLGITSDGKTLVSSGEDREIKLWNLATFEPRFTITGQSDWPQAMALSKDGKRLAVGRHDGSLDILNVETGKVVVPVRPLMGRGPWGQPDKPELVKNATLKPLFRKGVSVGSTSRMLFSGNEVGLAHEVLFSEPGFSWHPRAMARSYKGELSVDVIVPPNARPGLHQVRVVSSLGTTPEQTFAVEAFKPSNEVDPNDEIKAVKPIPFRTTLVGTIDKAGDVDHFRFAFKKGQPVHFEMMAKPLGSSLAGVLSLIDEQGQTLAISEGTEGTKDPSLSFQIARDGLYALRISDADYGGSNNHFYRIKASHDEPPGSAFPLGISSDATLTVFAVNGAPLAARGVPKGTKAGALVDVLNEFRPVGAWTRSRAVVADGPQGIEAEPNDEFSQASSVAVPGGISGVILRSGDVDHFRFEAKKGDRLVLEVFGRRLGSPIDSAIEILDAAGRPVPRALLRPVARTEVAFRDHNATNTGIRLTTWNNMAVNDVVLIGREVTKIFALPRNVDDDCQFWGENGSRVGLLETTPEHHPMGQPIYKVDIHPPGTSLPSGGVPSVTLFYGNDDGGPGFQKDSHLTFDPPSDGTYLVRVADVRQLGGPSYGYHLVIRRPHPGFEVSVSPENPNIPRGATTLVTVNVTRIDDFDGPVDVSAESLPAGITATPARIERGMTTALLGLTSEATAPAFSAPSWKIFASSPVGNGNDLNVPVRIIHDPGGERGGRITVTPPLDLKIIASAGQVVIRPGQEVTMKLTVERGPAFAGRVPIDVRNLPQGVRVLNIGLNGVLVTEKQTSRTITLYAEPWATPEIRPFYAVGKVEAAGTEACTSPIILKVEAEKSAR